MIYIVLIVLVLFFIYLYFDFKQFHKNLEELRYHIDKNNEYYSIVYNEDGSIMYYDFNNRQGMYKHSKDILKNKVYHIKDEDIWFYRNESDTFIALDMKNIPLNS
jgi:hypothetical protein